MIMKEITTKPSNVPLDFLDLDDLARIYMYRAGLFQDLKISDFQAIPGQLTKESIGLKPQKSPYWRTFPYFVFT